MTDLAGWATDVAALTTLLKEIKASGFGAGGIVSLVALTGVGPHAVTADHYGKQLLVDGDGVASATLRMPAAAPPGALVMARGLNCTLTILIEPGADLENWQGHAGSAAALAPITLTCRANADGASAIWMLDGATA